MIDTVRLLVPKCDVKTVSSDGEGSSWQLQSDTNQYRKWVKNPSAKDLATGRYFPRLTGYRRKSFSREDAVVLEFSVPKLLYLNNLDELDGTEFTKVVETLEVRLRQMGIIVRRDVLAGASVSSVHFSKNVLLRDGYTVGHLISEMNKVNLRKTFDLTRSRYINNGQSLYAHTASHQLVIYDKVADMGKPKKRAIDKDQTTYQMALFKELKGKPTLNEVIRFEIRLNHKRKMNKVLKGLGYSENPTFKDIFSVEMSKAVVVAYWQRLIKERNLGLFSLSLSLKDVLRAVCIADGNTKPKQAIYLVGLFMLGRDENGMRELRSIVDKRSHNRTWYRIASDMQKVSNLISTNKLRDWVSQIDDALLDYTAYRQEGFSTTCI